MGASSQSNSYTGGDVTCWYILFWKVNIAPAEWLSLKLNVVKSCIVEHFNRVRICQTIPETVSSQESGKMELVFVSFLLFTSYLFEAVTALQCYKCEAPTHVWNLKEREAISTKYERGERFERILEGRRACLSTGGTETDCPADSKSCQFTVISIFMLYFPFYDLDFMFHFLSICNQDFHVSLSWLDDMITIFQNSQSTTSVPSSS